MPTTMEDRLERMSEGHRMPLPLLGKLKADLDRKLQAIASLMADLEDGCEQFGISADLLLDGDTPRQDRGTCWEALSTAAGEVLIALAALRGQEP